MGWWDALLIVGGVELSTLSVPLHSYRLDLGLGLVVFLNRSASKTAPSAINLGV
jgi:hypothetical protein